MSRRSIQNHPAVGYMVRLQEYNTHPIGEQHHNAEGTIAQVWQFEAGLMVSVHLSMGVIVDGLLFGELTDRHGSPLQWR